jgi:hypothetical protein
MDFCDAVRELAKKSGVEHGHGASQAEVLSAERRLELDSPNRFARI